MRRQFGLDQDIPDDISFLMEYPTSVRPFLRHTAFEFWRQRFSVVTVPGSLREGLYTPPMHGYWQVVMTTFVDELVGSRDFSLNWLTLACFSLPNLFWRMLGDKTSQPFLNGTQRKKDGTSMLAIILLVRRKMSK